MGKGKQNDGFFCLILLSGGFYISLPAVSSPIHSSPPFPFLILARLEVPGEAIYVPVLVNSNSAVAAKCLPLPLIKQLIRENFLILD